MVQQSLTQFDDGDVYFALMEAHDAFGVRLPVAHIKNPLTVGDVASQFCVQLGATDEKTPGLPCRSMEMFYKLREKLAATRGLTEDRIQPTTPISAPLRGGRGQSWTDVANYLEVKLPLMVDDQVWGIYFILTFTLLALLTPLLIPALMPYFPCAMLLALITSALSTAALTWALTPILPRRKPPNNFQTVADVVCYAALQGAGIDRPWTRSEVRLMVRYLFAKVSGASIHQVPLRLNLGLKLRA